MSGNACQQCHLGVNIDFLAQDLHCFGTVIDDSAQGSVGLISGKKNGVPFIPQVMFQMMPDTASFAHSAGGYDHLGCLVCIQCF